MPRGTSIPADHKWFARICAGAVLAHALDRPSIPSSRRSSEDAVRDARRRPSGSSRPRLRTVPHPTPFAASSRRERGTARRTATQRQRQRQGSGETLEGRHGAGQQHPQPSGARREREGKTVETHAALRGATRPAGGEWYSRSPDAVAQALGGRTPPPACSAADCRGPAARRRTQRAAGREPRPGWRPLSSRSTAATCRSSWSPRRWCPC